MKRYCLIFLAILTLVGISGPSNATSFTIADTGLLLFGGIGFGSYSATALPSNFDLAEGDSIDSLGFFNVSLDSLAAGSGWVRATIDLVAPSNTALIQEGDYLGLSIPIWGGFSFTTGQITWGNPVQVDYGVGGLLELALSDVNIFGSGSSFPVTGTISNIHASSLDVTTAATPTPVPEPSTILLLGTGIMGLIVVTRKKLKK